MSKEKINETAGAGAIGTGSIAVSIGGGLHTEKGRKRFKDFLAQVQKDYRGNNGSGQFRPVKPFPISIKESFDIQDVLSRLTGMEKKSTDNPREFTTYGVEDDEGNVMKVTVRKDQAEEFEQYLAHKLGEYENTGIVGNPEKSISMAELLFNLKDKFTIVDVSFPEIPTDVIYNADKATTQVGNDNPNPVNSDMVTDDSVNMDDVLGDLDGMGDDDLPPTFNKNGKMDLNTMKDVDKQVVDDKSFISASGQDQSGEMDMNDEFDMNDAEGVEEFVDDESEDSILDKIIGILKSQAEAETAKANAEAEKYRAQQAEYSAKAANATIAQEEELAAMELQMDRQKEAEKQAKKLSDIAKWRASRGALNEADENESSIMVRKLISQLPATWAVSPDDDDQTKRYKNARMIADRKALQARLQSARLREAEARRLRDQGKNTNPDPNIQRAQQMRMQQQQQAGMGNTNPGM